MAIGGSLEDVPRGKKVFAVAAVIGAVMLAIAVALLLKSRKTMCAVEIYGTTPEDVEKRLNAACGPELRMNTGRDTSYVVFLAASTFLFLVWGIVTIVVLKQYLWDVLKKRTMRGVDTCIASYAIFGTFGMVFMLLALHAVNTARGRTCRGVPENQCKVDTYNDAIAGWVTVPTVVFGLLAIAPLWGVFRSRQFLE